MSMWLWIGCSVFAYAVGSIPVGWILVKRFEKIDLRYVGSGGIGATNVGREAGKGLAALTLFLDIMKGVVVILIAERFGWTEAESTIFGFVACVGHCFPIVLGGKGGKAVATACGVVLATQAVIGVIALIVWAVVGKVVRISSIASFAAVLSVIILTWINPHIALLQKLMVTAMAGLIIVMHRKNIDRIRHGEEKQFEFAGESSDEHS